MSLFTNQEVIYNILELLPTVTEALSHMQLQLEELRMEESALLFKDAAEAIGKIACYVLPLITENDEQLLLKLLAEVRKSIAMMNDAYEQKDLFAIKTALAQHLIPAFNAWQEQLMGRGDMFFVQ